MAEKTRRRRTSTADTWYLTYADRIRECRSCGCSIVPGSEFLFRRSGFAVMCAECGEGVEHEISNRLAIRRGVPGWGPNRWELSLLVALDGRYRTARELSAATQMHEGKAQGMLMHLRARQCVKRRGANRWEITDEGKEYLPHG